MLSKDKVEHIAKLARLGLKEEEIKKMQKELSVILDYFKLLDEVDTSNTDPAFYSPYLKNVMREDISENCEEEKIKNMIDQIPSKEGRYVKVKEVLK